MLREHEIQIRVRYSETDAMGYLYHGNYFSYFEMGRVEMLRAQGLSYREIEESGLLIVVVKISCRFRAPARYDDLLTLKTRLTKVTAAKLMHEYELWRDNTQLAVAESVLACVDRQGQPQRVPEYLHDI